MLFIMGLKKHKCIILLFIIFSFLFYCKNNNKQYIEASGTLEAIEVNVASKLAGKILNIYFDEGSLIKKDDILAQLDCINYELQLNQAKANLDLMQSQYNLIVKGARSEDIEQTDALLKQAESQFINATINYERIKNLFEKNVVSRKMLDDAKTQLDIAEAQFNQSKQAMKKVRKLSREEEIAMASAKLEQAKWAFKLSEQYVKDCIITSPIDGIVLTKVFETGEYVTPGATIATVTDLKKINAVVYLPETEIFLVKYGQNAKIKIDAYKDKTFDGKIIYISPEAEFTPKNIQTKDERVKLMFAVKILIDNPKMILKPGLPADVEFVE